MNLNINEEIVEKIDRKLDEMGLDIIDLLASYEKAGGDEIYTWWNETYGKELVDNWIKETEYRIMSAEDIFVEGVVVGLVKFIEWSRQLN